MLDSQPEGGVDDSRMRGKGDKTAGQVGELSRGRPLLWQSRSERGVAVAAALLAVCLDRIVHGGTFGLQVLVNRCICLHKRGIAQQAAERER